MAPASTVSVIRSRIPSSSATAAMPSGIPMPRFTIELIFSSIAARRAITLRASSAVLPGASDTTRTSPAYAGL